MKADNYPLEKEALDAFTLLKHDLASASLTCIREDMPFEIESDASDYAIGAILSQGGRPVAFMSRTLNACERNYPIIEKEATAVIEAVRKWAHFLKHKTLTLINDQKAVSHMFSKTNRGKIKNNKILLWRLELGQYHYEIMHKPGRDNVASDTFSRICAAQDDDSTLQTLHNSLGHPGYARLFHFVRARNLSYTSEDVKTICRNCQTCAEIKPRFYRPKTETLVKASKP